MVPIIIIPGWRDSPPGHWQSLWANELPGAVRVHQDDWVSTSRKAWVTSITQTILSPTQPVVIAAHILGCIATAHLPPEAMARIAAALLVAPADPERRSVLNDFGPVPYQSLPFKSIIVASNTDPICPVRTAAPMREPGVANLCASKTPATSTWRPVLDHGRWGWRCCRPSRTRRTVRTSQSLPPPETQSNHFLTFSPSKDF